MAEERKWLKYAEQIAGRPLKEYEVGATVEDVKKRARRRKAGLPVVIAGQTIVAGPAPAVIPTPIPAIIPPVSVIPVTPIGETKMAYAGLQLPEWIQDIIGGIDPFIPEELLGIDITPGVRVGAEKKGRVLYDNVWIEDGKVKVVRKGSLRVLGYTPQEAKKRFKTRRRRKRLTKRDIYIIEALKDGASPAAIAIL